MQASKLTAILHSRKFWALVTALVTVIGGVASGTVTAEAGVLGAVAALAAYSIGTGIEASGQAVAAAAPASTTVFVAPPTAGAVVPSGPGPVAPPANAHP